MKLFAVLLVLLVVSGCLARRPRPSGERWEAAVDRFADYVSGLSSDHFVKDVHRLEMSKELETLIQNTVDELAQYRDDVQTNLGPFARDSAQRLGRDLGWLGKKLRDHMMESKGHLTQYVQELREVMELNADDVRQRLHAYSRKMRKRLARDVQEIRSHVQTFFEEFQHRTSQNVDTLWSRFDPFFANVRDNTEDKAGTLGQLIKTQVEQIQDAVEDFKEGMVETGKNLKDTLEEKMGQVRSWFENLFRV